MKGKLTLNCTPFRYGGFFHDFDRDNEQTAEALNIKEMKCWCCGGIMKNHHFSDGAVHRFWPYVATFRITKGKNKGLNKFRMLCRSCAYGYGFGVTEMDGNTYKNPNDFNEEKYKRDTGYQYSQKEKGR